MTSTNNKRYDNLSEAVAFAIHFTPFVYTYGDVGWDDYDRVICSRCGKTVQYGDFLAPKSSCNKDFAILDSYHYGVSKKVRDELISHFEITESDFRPIRNKVGDIVFYQITPQHTMLPISSVNRIRELKPCRKCGEVQYRQTFYKNKNGFEYFYITPEALRDMHDLNETYEKFDMYLPEYIISRRVYDYLSSTYPRMTFDPIFLKEQQV